MDVNPVVSAGRQMIEAYRDGCFRISGVEHRSSVIVTPERTLAWDRNEGDSLLLGDFSAVIATEPALDVLLIGFGRRSAPLSAALHRALREAGIGADAMDTGAACRTFNILVSENRRVAAALMAFR